MNDWGEDFDPDVSMYDVDKSVFDDVPEDDILDDGGDSYDSDEYDTAEDELCDCGRKHFSLCYFEGCLGMRGNRWQDSDEDEDWQEDAE